MTPALSDRRRTTPLDLVAGLADSSRTKTWLGGSDSTNGTIPRARPSPEDLQRRDVLARFRNGPRRYGVVDRKSAVLLAQSATSTFSAGVAIVAVAVGPTSSCALGGHASQPTIACSPKRPGLNAPPSAARGSATGLMPSLRPALSGAAGQPASRGSEG